MENMIVKTTETLKKELETLNDKELHELFLFFYRLNHKHGNIITAERFDEFLEAFDSNPFRLHDDKAFRKQLIENLIKYTDDHMSLITAAVLIKKEFTTEEIISNYYANVNAFGTDLF